jgi:hypothetical protein
MFSFFSSWFSKKEPVYNPASSYPYEKYADLAGIYSMRGKNCPHCLHPITQTFKNKSRCKKCKKVILKKVGRNGNTSYITKKEFEWFYIEYWIDQQQLIDSDEARYWLHNDFTNLFCFSPGIHTTDGVFDSYAMNVEWHKKLIQRAGEYNFPEAKEYFESELKRITKKS